MKHYETLEHSSFDATISALDARTSALNAETSAVGAATSAITRSYRQYRRGVSGDIGDCGVGIPPQMCNRVTNHGDVSTFSKPGVSYWKACINLDDWIFDWLLASMAAVHAEDVQVHASFLFVGYLNGLFVGYSNRHGAAAFDFATVSGCDQLVGGPTHARGASLQSMLNMRRSSATIFG